MSISPTRKECYLVPWLLARLVPAFVAWNLLSGTSSSGRWRCGDPGLALLIAATLLYTVQSLAAFLLQSVSSPRVFILTGSYCKTFTAEPYCNIVPGEVDMVVPSGLAELHIIYTPGRHFRDVSYYLSSTAG
ncbi:hypothetical protein F4776DRAFT_377336 [Hypoxylon sp. NC0597]|nr:hypothetical protein F4776DRAFT_377336 [Hypoxylon sp. NC0597]